MSVAGEAQSTNYVWICTHPREVPANYFLQNFIKKWFICVITLVIHQGFFVNVEFFYVDSRSCLYLQVTLFQLILPKDQSSGCLIVLC
jgi:hypothetical protein